MRIFTSSICFLARGIVDAFLLLAWGNMFPRCQTIGSSFTVSCVLSRFAGVCFDHVLSWTMCQLNNQIKGRSGCKHNDRDPHQSENQPLLQTRRHSLALREHSATTRCTATSNEELFEGRDNTNCKPTYAPTTVNRALHPMASKEECALRHHEFQTSRLKFVRDGLEAQGFCTIKISVCKNPARTLPWSLVFTPLLPMVFSPRHVQICIETDHIQESAHALILCFGLKFCGGTHHPLASHEMANTFFFFKIVTCRRTTGSQLLPALPLNVST